MTNNVFHLLPGDGANDVSMIQVADIGVGISGPEGMQVIYVYWQVQGRVKSIGFSMSKCMHLVC